MQRERQLVGIIGQRASRLEARDARDAEDLGETIPGRREGCLPLRCRVSERPQGQLCDRGAQFHQRIRHRFPPVASRTGEQQDTRPPCLTEHAVLQELLQLQARPPLGVVHHDQHAGLALPRVSRQGQPGLRIRLMPRLRDCPSGHSRIACELRRQPGLTLTARPEDEDHRKVTGRVPPRPKLCQFRRPPDKGHHPAGGPQKSAQPEPLQVDLGSRCLTRKFLKPERSGRRGQRGLTVPVRGPWPVVVDRQITPGDVRVPPSMHSPRHPGAMVGLVGLVAGYHADSPIRRGG